MGQLAGIVFSDLANQCTPRTNISFKRELGKWNAVPYETVSAKGTLLGALHTNRPQPVTLDPQLKGWHRIFVGVVITTSNDDWAKNIVPLRLSGDAACTSFTPFKSLRGGGVEDAFWKCADMTGQSVEISKYPRGMDNDVIIAWVRFVPMTDEEVREYLADLANPANKRLYATNEIFSGKSSPCLRASRFRTDNVHHPEPQKLHSGTARCSFRPTRRR